MILNDDQIQELKTTVSMACEDRLGEEIEEIVRYVVKQYGNFEENDLPKLKEVFDSVRWPPEEWPKRLQELQNRAYDAESELHKLKTSLEQKRHWLPLMQKLRDILASRGDHETVAIIDNYIVTGQL